MKLSDITHAFFLETVYLKMDVWITEAFLQNGDPIVAYLDDTDELMWCGIEDVKGTADLATLAVMHKREYIQQHINEAKISGELSTIRTDNITILTIGRSTRFVNLGTDEPEEDE